MAKKSKSTGKPAMPGKYKGLAPAEIDALVAYMQSLK
jgi:mono/diheme cytochrome c family protein